MKLDSISSGYAARCEAGLRPASHRPAEPEVALLQFFIILRTNLRTKKFPASFAAGASYGKYYPWLLPMNIFLEGRFTMALLLGVGGGIIAALAGCAECVRRDVA